MGGPECVHNTGTGTGTGTRPAPVRVLCGYDLLYDERAGRAETLWLLVHLREIGSKPTTSCPTHMAEAPTASDQAELTAAEAPAASEADEVTDAMVVQDAEAAVEPEEDSAPVGKAARAAAAAAAAAAEKAEAEAEAEAEIEDSPPVGKVARAAAAAAAAASAEEQSAPSTSEVVDISSAAPPPASKLIEPAQADANALLIEEVVATTEETASAQVHVTKPLSLAPTSEAEAGADDSTVATPSGVTPMISVIPDVQSGEAGCKTAAAPAEDPAAPNVSAAAAELMKKYDIAEADVKAIEGTGQDGSILAKDLKDLISPRARQTAAPVAFPVSPRPVAAVPVATASAPTVPVPVNPDAERAADILRGRSARIAPEPMDVASSAVADTPKSVHQEKEQSLAKQVEQGAKKTAGAMKVIKAAYHAVNRLRGKVAEARSQADDMLDEAEVLNPHEVAKAKMKAKMKAMKAKLKTMLSPAYLWSAFNLPLRALFFIFSLFLMSAMLFPLLAIFSALRLICPRAWYFLANPLFAQMWALCIVGFEMFGGVKINFFGDEPMLREKLVILANHHSPLDFLVLVGLAARFGALGGVRFVAKTPVNCVPLLGWLMFLNQSTVNIGITTAARLLADYSQPCWICFFPENNKLVPNHMSLVDWGLPFRMVKALVFFHANKAKEAARQKQQELAEQSAQKKAELQEEAKKEMGKVIGDEKPNEGDKSEAEEGAAEPPPSPPDVEAVAAGKYTHLSPPHAHYLRLALKGASPPLTHAIDMTLTYHGDNPSVWKGLFGFVSIDVLMRRVKLPSEEEDPGEWLQGIWAKKDAALQAWKEDSACWFEEAAFQHASRRVLPLLCGLIVYALPYLALAAAALMGLLLEKERRSETAPE